MNQKAFFNQSSKLVKYFSLSCLSAAVDYAVTAVLFYIFNMHYILTNMCGLFAGFILHYMMGSRVVFNTKMEVKSLAVYGVTFFLGIHIANGSLWFCYKFLGFDFNISKCISMAVPFFAMYHMRLFLHCWLYKEKNAV